MPVCNHCGTHFPNSILMNGERKYLNSRKFCLSCSPWGLKNRRSYVTKNDLLICSTCKENKPSSEFYDKGKSKQSYCKSCFNKYCTERWIEKRLRAIQYLGGVCVDCGQSYPRQVYDFHHLDPTQKDTNWQQLRYKSWSSITKELDKCVLLCANCHRIRHAS